MMVLETLNTLLVSYVSEHTTEPELLAEQGKYILLI